MSGNVFLIKSFVPFVALALLFSPLAVGNQDAAKLSDEALLDRIERQSLDYFLMESNPANGLVRDKASNFRNGPDNASASIAAVGFALTAYGVAASRNWMDLNTARERTRRTLEFFLQQAPHEHGFFYHFLDLNRGTRINHSELSPIDTTLFLAGVLFAAEYYNDPEIRSLAAQIYERVDWTWMLHGGKTLALEWSPQAGFSRWRWDHYCESLLMYLLAIGSPTHPIPASSWKEIRRPVGSYGPYRLIQMPPLFTHQYSHIWIDFKNQNDGLADYFQNSVNATLANRQFAIDNAALYKTYGPDSWGLSASDGPSGYRAYGAPPGWAEHDGTVAPSACGSSIVFTPKESIACLRHFYENDDDSLWGRYGFSDALNKDRNWVSRDVIGIDQGTLLLMIENYRSGLIWKIMGRNRALQQAMKAVGFRPGTISLPWPDPPQVKARYASRRIEIDGYLRDWPNGEAIVLDHSFATVGEIRDDQDLKAEIGFAWDEHFLYFYIKAKDDHVIGRKNKKNIWQDDALELFIDPEADGFYWKDPKDFQLGFRLAPVDDTVATWSWFQDEDPSEKGSVQARGYVYQNGYLIEGAIAWEYLGIRPQAGMALPLSPAVHDMDRDRSEGKLEWFFRSQGKWKQFELGRVVLENKEKAHA